MFSKLNQPPSLFFIYLCIYLFMYLCMYLLRHKTVQTNDQVRRFGVVMTPSLRRVFLVMQITAFNAMWRET